MPSSPGYVRNYDREWSSAKQRGEGKDNRLRHRLRFAAEKKGIVRKNDGKDLAHRKAVAKGGRWSLSNVRPQAPSANRSFARTKTGGLRSEYATRERMRRGR